MKLALILATMALCGAAVAQTHRHGGDDDDWADMVGISGSLGPYIGAREATGTSWQPDATRHDGLHFAIDGWMIMAHGEANLVYSDQGGSRGEEQAVLSGMGMLSARRDLVEGQTLTLRAML